SQASELIASNYFGINLVRFDTATGQNLGAYSGGTLSGPLGMRIGPGGLLYVCSETNNTVQRFSLSTHAYVDTTVTDLSLRHPAGVASDSSNNIQIANFVNSTITKYSPSGTFLSTLVASGSGGLNGPDVGSVIGPDGKLYVPSFNSNAVLRYDATTGAFLDT